MRFVIYGAGAIGGVIAARLDAAGQEVAVIARGRHLEAIRAHGLTLLTPAGESVHRLAAAADPAELGVGRDEDVIMLAVKGQDTAGALAALRAAGAERTPIVCLQNGVENERLALRMFPEVYGAVIMLPATHLEPGLVLGYGAKLAGIVDVGRYPAGTDPVCDEITAALASARVSSRSRPDIMRSKYAKLLLNLANAVDAMCGDAPGADALSEAAKAEGRAVLAAAAIDADDPDVNDRAGRWDRIGVGEIEGHPRGGSSSWQSLARGTGTIEADFLNGEIALLGRLHEVPTPVNAALARLAAHHARIGTQPGSVSVTELQAAAAA